MMSAGVFGIPGFRAAFSTLFLNPLYRETAKICRNLGIADLLRVSVSDDPYGAVLWDRLEIAYSPLSVSGMNLCKGEESRLSCVTRPQGAVLLYFVLSALRREDRMEVLREAGRVGRHVILVDYRNPERNLDIPAVLAARALNRLAGRDRRECCRDFYRHNAVEGMTAALYTFAAKEAAEQSLENAGQGGTARYGGVLFRKPVLGGAASLIVWKTVR